MKPILNFYSFKLGISKSTFWTIIIMGNLLMIVSDSYIRQIETGALKISIILFVLLIWFWTNIACIVNRYKSRKKGIN
jgi:hypothetical protein